MTDSSQGKAEADSALMDEYGELAHRLFREFGIMHRRMAGRMGNAASGEMAVMRALTLSGGELTPSELADRAWVSNPRVANILRSLESKGWITREPDPSDRRRVIVRTTDAGRAALAEKRALFDRSTAEFLSELGHDDARELLRLMERMNQIIEKNQGRLIEAVLKDEK